MTCCRDYDSPVGRLFLTASDGKLTGLWIEGARYFCGTLKEVPRRGGEEQILDQAAEWLDRYFAGERPSPSRIPLDPAGTGFQRLIWRLLCRIPYGETITYGELARLAADRMGRERMSARAVGAAVGRNPVSLIIPCHRVVGSGGRLTGYAAGIEKKRFLLALEGVRGFLD